MARACMALRMLEIVPLATVLTATRRSLACACFALCSRVQLKRSTFIALCKRLEGYSVGEEHLALSKPIGRARTFDEGMEKDLVSMCMGLKNQYHTIDDSHIIMCAAELIGVSRMSREQKLSALSRVRRGARCALCLTCMRCTVWRHAVAVRGEGATQGAARLHRPPSIGVRTRCEGTRCACRHTVPMTFARNRQIQRLRLTRCEITSSSQH